jgi:hypothetical protein
VDVELGAGDAPSGPVEEGVRPVEAGQPAGARELCEQPGGVAGAAAEVDGQPDGAADLGAEE